MIHIAEVIGWKFDHQEGMSCRENDKGVLVITEFPGGIPSQADQDAWTAEYEALQPTRDWEVAMTETDSDIPRELEDLYDAMSPATQAKVATKTRDKIIAKKALRGTKP